MNSERPVPLLQLFLSFLKIGSISFGGNMALVSVVQNHVVKQKHWLDDEVIMDGISLCTVLPGPLGVNLIAFAGYKIRGLAGALVCMLGVLLPAFILVTGLSYLYFTYGRIPVVKTLLHSIEPVITGVIIATVIPLGKKNVTNFSQLLIALMALGIMIFVRGDLAIFTVILLSGFAGWMLYRQGTSKMESVTLQTGKIVPLILLIILPIAIFHIPGLVPDEGLRQLGRTFSTMSLTLFGGGYVFIPTIGTIVTHTFHWLSMKEFTDGIAIGQITPGPILITSAFIGYKISGVAGALLATIATFLPPALLTMTSSHFLNYLKTQPIAQSILSGIRPAIIGMLASAVFFIGRGAVLEWQSWLLCIIVVIAILRFKLDASIVIPSSVILGYLLFML